MSLHAALDFSFSDSPDRVYALMKSSELNNKAFSIMDGKGDFGTDHTTTAVAYNNLGELYVKMNRLAEAERYLKKALEIRTANGLLFDAAVSRENLAQASEARGDFAQAKEIRLLGAPNHLACGHSKCFGEMFKLSELKLCGRCKSVYYCSPTCQAQDWKKRHKRLCKVA